MAAPVKRKILAPRDRRRMLPATVLLGWTSTGRPVSSLPLRTSLAVQNRIKTWRRKGYRVSSLVEWDFM